MVIETKTLLQKAERLSNIKEYMSLATLYVVTDVAYDYGLLNLPYPMGDILYYGRYCGVLIWYTVKFCRKRFGRLQSNAEATPNSKLKGR